jgi:imidazole glycerol-phosphate synthase subunit HisH
MITIVDYGLGNFGSIQNMLKYIGEPSIVTSDVNYLLKAEKLILPGVGHFDRGMLKINTSGLRDVLNKKVLGDKVPVLGICLGMQLLTDGSEEGSSKGLGWIPGYALRFNFIDKNLKIPHMGWNNTSKNSESLLTVGFNNTFRFYFVHSYYVQVLDHKNSILKTTYGLEFDSAIQFNNIYGVQFHPEKSHKFGMSLLRNFSKL